MLIPCPGCGALFPPYDGPTHRYLGASAACWALCHNLTTGTEPDSDLLRASRVPVGTPTQEKGALRLEHVWGDAYGVQHHGGTSAQAIQSVVIHLLTLHGAVTRGADGNWVKRRALRTRGVFRKLQPPPLGCALTIRHLFPCDGADATATRVEYAHSVYSAWMGLHRLTVESWYQRYVTQD